MSVSISPPNALLLVMDPTTGVVPESMDGKLVSSTASCIAVGTRPPSDGETKVSFRSYESPQPGLVKTYEGTIDIAGPTIAICTVYGDTILTKTVDCRKSKVTIWVDDTVEPTEIEVHVEDVFVS